MASLLSMPKEEYAQQGRSATPAVAITLSIASGVFAYAGMVLRYRPGDDVPIAGMDDFFGQLFLSVGLTLLLLFLTMLIRGVMMKRVQWAVVISLLIHLLICLSLRVVFVSVLSPVMADAGATEEYREVALPDYGGVESTPTEEQTWQQPSNVEIQQTPEQQLERQTADIPSNAEPERVEAQQSIADAQVPDRQQQQEHMQDAIEHEMQRTAQRAHAESPDQTQTPTMRTAESSQPQLDPREIERQQANPQNARRRIEQVDAHTEQSLDAAAVSPRSDVQPSELQSITARQNPRAPRQTETESESAENIRMADTADVSGALAGPRSLNVERQTQSQLTERSQSSLPRTDSSSPSFQSVNPSRSSRPSSPSFADISGGRAGLPRRTMQNSRNTSAAETQATDVSTAPATASSGTPVLNAASTTEVTRGRSGLPARSPGRSEGSGRLMTVRNGPSSLSSGAVGQAQGNRQGPTLGAAVGNGTSGGRSARTGRGVPGAAETTASLQAPGSGSSGGAGAAGGTVDQGTGSALASGPSSRASGIGRRTSTLPGSMRSGGTGGPGTGTGASDQASVAPGAIGRSGLAGRSASAGARLQGNLIAGSSGGRSTGRTGPGVSLPAGALEVAGSPGGGTGTETSGDIGTGSERVALPAASGDLATGGEGAGSGQPGGPRGASLRRTSAGLPGIRVGGGGSGLTRSRPSLPGALSGSGIGRRASTSGSAPTLASSSEIAAMVRRNVPGISDVLTERISATFSMRTPEARREAVERLGGSDESEKAVELGLKWLAAHQFADGHWSVHDMNCTDHRCTGHGSSEADAGATGMALLAFLGAGNTHRSGPYTSEVGRGIKWLLANQQDSGDLSATQNEYVRFYSHGIAAIALCEAYGMTRDPQLEEPAQAALDFIVASQHPTLGGWRYKPRTESDTSVSGWQLMALKSGQIAGLKASSSAFRGVADWLDRVEDKTAPGRFAYHHHPSYSTTETMTAEGLLMRQYLGASRNDAALNTGAKWLQQRLPHLSNRNAYYWYYGTQVMFHLQGEHWQNWNASIRPLLESTQEQQGPSAGSWDPDGAKRGHAGGRHYVTCLNLLMLEVYYRHLPLYINLRQ